MYLLNITDGEVNIPNLQGIASVQPARDIDLNVSGTSSASGYTYVSDSTSTSSKTRRIQPVSLLACLLTHRQDFIEMYQ